MLGRTDRFEDEGVRIFTVDNLTVATWFNAPTFSQMRELDRAAKTLRTEVEGGVSMINVIVSGVPRFTADVREEVIRQTADEDGRDLANAHLILLGGLTGSAVRAFMSTVVLVGRPATPTKVFGSKSTAARFLAGHLAHNTRFKWSETRLLEVIEAAAEAPGAGARP